MGVAAGCSQEYPAGGVRFDGTNDYLAIQSDLTGAADGPYVLVSFWFQMLGNDAVDNDIFYPGGTFRMRIQREGSGVFNTVWRNTAGANSFICQSTSGVNYNSTTNTGWHHFLFAINQSTPVVEMYIDDADVAASPSASSTGTLEQTFPSWGVGAQPNGSKKLNGDMAEFYYTNEFLDISVESNRRKFISAAGQPVDLGANGSDPTGTQPLIYFRRAPADAASTFGTNLGSGGAFSITGTLTNSADNPC